MPNQELDSNQPGKCVKFKGISSKNKSLINFHAVQGHWLQHSLSCFLCPSSTLSSIFRSKNIRRAWLIDLGLCLDVTENVNDTILTVRPGTATGLQRQQPGSIRVTHGLIKQLASRMLDSRIWCEPGKTTPKQAFAGCGNKQMLWIL